MKSYLKAYVAILLALVCFLSACSSTRLHGVVYTSDKQPARDSRILVRAEPGNQATWVKEDGSFELKGLERDHVYTIIAVSAADNTEARAQMVHIKKKGENTLAENQMLILAVPITTPPSQDTTGIKDQGKGTVVPETP